MRIGIDKLKRTLGHIIIICDVSVDRVIAPWGSLMCTRARVRVCVCVCLRECVRVGVYGCVRARVHGALMNIHLYAWK